MSTDLGDPAIAAAAAAAATSPAHTGDAAHPTGTPDAAMPDASASNTPAKVEQPAMAASISSTSAHAVPGAVNVAADTPAGQNAAPPTLSHSGSTPGPDMNTNLAGQSVQTPGPAAGIAGSVADGANTPARRIQRAARACEICHSRKVRCDASTLGVPCTNCQAFGFDCKIPSAGRRKKNKANGTADVDGPDKLDSPEEDRKTALDKNVRQWQATAAQHTPSVSIHPPGSKPVPLHNIPDKSNIYVEFADRSQDDPAIPDNGRVAYLGESSNLSFIVRRKAADDSEKEIFHYPVPDVFNGGSKMKLSILDADEIEMLKGRGAFLLPPRDVCDDLVETYFTKVAPQIPIINRTQFMKQYNDANDPPPLLLLQVIFLAASRVSTNPAIVDVETGSTDQASITFWKRAKALYDADYEDDKVVIIQALLLLSWWLGGPEDVTRNVWYWVGTAIRVAQGIGMHRSVAKAKMSTNQKRTWRRIWWTCFAQDRRVAVSMGRPMCINVEDSDMEMIVEEDFIEEDVPTGTSLKYPPNRNHVLYFIQSVKLAEIMGVVLSRQYSPASRKARVYQSLDLTQSDMALANWLMNLPPEMQYHCTKSAPEQNFWAAFLHMSYYTVLCLLHRPHLKSSVRSDSSAAAYPSRNIAFTAANMITRILEDVVHYRTIKYLPSFSIYAIFSAMIFHSFEIRSQNQAVVEAAHKKLSFCMGSLKELSKVWMVANSIATLFEAISESKILQERFQKTALMLGSGSGNDSRKRRAPEQLPDPRRVGKSPGAAPQEQQAANKSPNMQAPAAPARPAIGTTHGQTGAMMPQAFNVMAGANDAMLFQNPLEAGIVTTPGGTVPSGVRASATAAARNPEFFFFSTNQQMPQNFWESYQPNFLFPQEALAGTAAAQQRGQQLQQQQQQQQQLQAGLAKPGRRTSGSRLSPVATMTSPTASGAGTMPAPSVAAAGSAASQSPLTAAASANMANVNLGTVAGGGGIVSDYLNMTPFVSQGDWDWDMAGLMHYPESENSNDGQASTPGQFAQNAAASSTSAGGVGTAAGGGGAPTTSAPTSVVGMSPSGPMSAAAGGGGAADAGTVGGVKSVDVTDVSSIANAAAVAAGGAAVTGGGPKAATPGAGGGLTAPGGVPESLNVEEWYHFLGLGADGIGLGGANSYAGGNTFR